MHNDALYGKEIMSKIIDLATNNALLSGLILAAIIGIVSLLWRKYQDHQDSEAIFNFLIASEAETPHTFRSTEAIAAKTKLTQNRVEELCTKHKKIQRNSKEKQSWKLVE
ncbi:hypothetical protein [Permianibacter aggregans]|uniref:Uncharacterized protein n=1 Tax=Permianibacter aggregans TaxID=1510150 RepID=A0A4R6UKL0_9GAMM|nr:hypothetical protein [Permianibacter aggregans]QGX40162.1 hypothetical protein E2H98_10965 [Permianibacter aggregans]TDQ47411.1 hypothetical protein EV696_1103 [Permianibacter aggregans]